MLDILTLDTDTSRLKFSRKICNCLHRAHIYTICDLVSLTEEEVLGLSGLSCKEKGEVLGGVAARGFCFSKDTNGGLFRLFLKQNERIEKSKIRASEWSKKWVADEYIYTNLVELSEQLGLDIERILAKLPCVTERVLYNDPSITENRAFETVIYALFWVAKTFQIQKLSKT